MAGNGQSKFVLDARDGYGLRLVPVRLRTICLIPNPNAVINGKDTLSQKSIQLIEFSEVQWLRVRLKHIYRHCKPSL